MGVNQNPHYSVVVPLYNEAGNVIPLISEILAVMASLSEPWELICVDDGSTDQTCKKLDEIARNEAHILLIKLHRNYGQSTALAAGFRQARGEIVITLDGDGQNDPADIPALLGALRDCDLVSGYRKERHDHWGRRIVSRVANAIRKRLCGDGMSDSCCALKACRRECLNRIKLFDGMHRFLPALFLIEGYRICEIPVRHRPRRAGLSKYPCYRRVLKPIVDLCAVIWMRKRHLTYSTESSRP